MEQRIGLRTADGVMDVLRFEPEAGAGPWPGVILYMDAFGVRPNLEMMARRLASLGCVVALPDLYHRTGGYERFDPSAVLVEGDERARFRRMIASTDRAKVMRDTEAVIAHLDRTPEVRNGRLGAIGYCMGGGYALAAAGTFPDRIAVAASFHGGSLATDKPDSPHLLAPRIRARVYVGAAEIDPTFPPDQQERLRRAFEDGGTDYRMEIYPGARHGFAVTGHLAYDPASSERHWTVLETLIGDI